MTKSLFESLHQCGLSHRSPGHQGSPGVVSESLAKMYRDLGAPLPTPHMPQCHGQTQNSHQSGHWSPKASEGFPVHVWGCRAFTNKMNIITWSKWDSLSTSQIFTRTALFWKLTSDTIGENCIVGIKPVSGVRAFSHLQA